MAISNTDKLDIYNGALRRLGARRLASLTENREPRRVLDDIWDNGGVVKCALERGDWNFAIRSVQVAYDPGVTTQFGFRYAFAKPDDFSRLASLSADEYFRVPLTDLQYRDEGGYWLADHQAIFVRYVSSGDAHGFDSSRWTESFKEYLEASIAADATERITNSSNKRAENERAAADALKTAKSIDAMQEGVKFRPVGGWVGSRGSAWGGSRER